MGGACPSILLEDSAAAQGVGSGGDSDLQVKKGKPEEDACGFVLLPSEVHAALGLDFIGQPQHVAPLACVSRELRARLSDSHGRLCVHSINASRLVSAAGGLQRVSFQCLTALRVDLLEQSAVLLRRDVEGLVAHLGDCLSKGMVLSALAIRLASFDAALERLWLGRQAWGALVRGLAALGRHRQLRSLELSYVAIKLSQATQPVAPCEQEEKAAAGPLTLMRALGGLSTLEELSITHADLFGSTVVALAEVLRELPRLRRVDLTRNRISSKVLAQFREAMPPQVHICGGDLQTFFCEEPPTGWRGGIFGASGQ